jgi:phage tail-like protein
MALPELDSAVGASFAAEVDGIQIRSITEVSGLKMEQDVIELKQNIAEGKYSIKKLPGRWKSGEVTLTRPLTGDTSFEKWIKDSRFGKMGDSRKNMTVTIYDFEGAALKRYNLTAAWPKSLEIGSLKAGDTNALTEKVVITYETMEPA